MKSKLSSYLLLFAGILLVICCVLTSSAIASKADVLNGWVGYDKVVLNLKDRSASTNLLTIENANELKALLGSQSSGYLVEAGIKQTKTSLNSGNFYIKGVNGEYSRFISSNMLSGSWFTEKAALENEYVAVLDKKTAWDLFKSIDVTGQEIFINDISFIITGVVDRDESFFSLINETQNGLIYLPAGICLDMWSDLKINTLMYQRNDTWLRAKAETYINQAMSELSLSSSAYKITDFSDVAVLARNAGSYILLFISIGIWFVLFKLFFKGIDGLFHAFSQKPVDTVESFMHGKYYRFKAILLPLVFIILSAAGIYFVYRMVAFNFFIPPKYLPTDLTDISWYFNLFTDNLKESYTNLGYIPSFWEITSSSLAITETIFLALCFAGMFLIKYGMHLLVSKNEGLLKITCICGFFAAFIFAIWSYLAAGYGLDPRTKYQAAILLWSYIFFKLLNNVEIDIKYNFNNKNGGYKNVKKKKKVVLHSDNTDDAVAVSVVVQR